MRNKRFKHHVDTFCKIFCGWQICNDVNSLVALGNGELKIDILTGSCTFNKLKTKKLFIAKALESWFVEDINKHNISTKDISEATLTVQLIVKPPESGSRFCNFGFDCTGSIVSNSDVYTNNFKDYQKYECKVKAT